MTLSWTVVRETASKEADEPVSVALYRWWTPYVSWLLSRIGVRANWVTVTGALAGAIGAVATAWGTWWALAAGAFLLQVYAVGDHVDGEVARLRGETSWQGAWLDTSLNHLFAQPLLTAVPTVAAWRLGAPGWVLVLGLLAAWSLHYSMSVALARFLGAPSPETGQSMGGRSALVSRVIQRSVQFVEMSLLMPVVVAVSLLAGSYWPALAVAFYYGGVYPLLTVAHVVRVARTPREAL